MVTFSLNFFLALYNKMLPTIDLYKYSHFSFLSFSCDLEVRRSKKKQLYNSSYQQPVMTAIATPGFVMPSAANFGDYPVQCKCPRCGNQIVTRTEKISGMYAWSICVLLCFFMCWPCACIPFCTDSCKVS